MIIPTAKHDPMYADDGVPFREKMVQYIRQHFSETLGPHVGLLDSDEGLAMLSRMYWVQLNKTSHDSKAA